MEIELESSNRSPVSDNQAQGHINLEKLCQQCREAFGWVISTLMDYPDSSRGSNLGCNELPDPIDPDDEGLIGIFGSRPVLRPNECCATCRLQYTPSELYVYGGTTTNFRKAKDGSAFNKIELVSIWKQPDAKELICYIIAYTWEPPHGVVSCQMPSSWIDYDWLREKLDQCILMHAKCHSSSKSATKLRLINVEGEGRLEDFEQGREIDYIALSYVWGTSSYKPDDRKRFDPEPLIKDAMLVTKRLGYKYLWVDRYCIKDGEYHKQLMINQMDRVYSKACATIIASTCVSAQDHLPGVHGPPQGKWGQQVEFDKVRFVDLGDTPDKVVRSKWASRGWTYQEGYLSQRRLIFTEGGVIFLCNQECFRETQRGSAGSFLDRQPPHDFFWMLPQWDDTWNGLLAQIIQYSQRHLTFEGDILRAFQGIMRHYETSGTAELISHLWGIPISYEMMASPVRGEWARIKICLNWRHSHTRERRNDFPSWSWTGWVGMIDSLAYQGAESYSEQQDIDCSICDTIEGPTSAGQLPWHIEVGDGDRRSTLSQYVRDQTSQACFLSEQGAMNVWQPRELWITSYVMELRFHQVQLFKNSASQIFARLPVGGGTYLDLNPRFDSEWLIRGGLGVILPSNCERFWQIDQSIYYYIVILHRISETKFERAGVLRFHYDAKSGLTEDIEGPGKFSGGMPNEYPFLKDAKWETICLV